MCGSIRDALPYPWRVLVFCPDILGARPAGRHLSREGGLLELLLVSLEAETGQTLS